MNKIHIKNSLTGLLQLVINSTLVFIGISIFIDKLGQSTYGIFALVSIVGNLNVFSNLGLNQSLVRFLSVQGKAEESNYDIIVSFCFISIVLLPITILLILYREFLLVNLLNIPSEYLIVTSDFFLFVLLANYVLMIGQIMNSVIQALQKFYLVNYLNLFYSIMYWGSIIATISLGYGLVEIGLLNLLISLVWFFVLFVVFKYTWGTLQSENLKLNFLRILKKQIAYGVKIYTSGVISFFYEPLTKILISNFIGLNEVGIYEIALKLKNQLIGILNKILEPFYPYVAKEMDKNKISFIIKDLEEKIILLIVPTIITIYFCVFPFVEFWLGEASNLISYSIIILCASNLLGYSTVPNYQYLMAKNLAGKTVIMQLINVLLNFIIIILVIDSLGIYGGILGNSLGILGSFTANLFFQKKYLNNMIFDNFKQKIMLSFSFLVIVLPSYLIDNIVSVGELKLVIIPIFVFTITYFIYRLTNLVTRKDLEYYFKFN